MAGFTILFMNADDMNQSLLAEQKITILPDAHSDTAVRFIDMTSYFVPVGEKLILFNNDFVGHKLILTNEDNSTQIQEIDLPSNSSFSFEFEEPGQFYYSSKDYPKIQGSIRVLDPPDISVEKITGLENNVDVQLAWTTSRVLSNSTAPNSDQKVNDYDEDGGDLEVDFIITFINNKTGANHEHVDYTYIIFDESGNELFNQGLHSTYGVEEAKYNFEEEGNFRSQVMITHILFAPVKPDLAAFDIRIPVDQSTLR